MAEINDPILREMGAKLANFRRKLGDSIGRKIIQAVFGEMFGGYSPRNIETYEGGKVEIPARLLFMLWKQGNSIDALFAEGDITELGKKCAQILFEQSILSVLHRMNGREMERVKNAVAEAKSDETKTTHSTEKRSTRTPGKPAGGHLKTRHVKKS